MRTRDKLIRLALVALILAGGAGLAVFFIATKPVAERRPAEIVAPPVETVMLTRADAAVTVAATGTVEAVQSVDLRPQVSGRVVAVAHALVPGGRVAAGEVLVRLDDTDFKLALDQARAGLERALHDLEVEQGQQAVARTERALLSASLTPAEEDLVLRRPQLRLAEANVASARAAVRGAELNLARTTVTAPFAGMVLDKSVAVGSQVGPTATLARLVATDAYWVRLALPVDELRWLDLPGSSVRLTHPAGWPDGAFRTGTVIELAGELGSSGRMAQLIVEVPDPLARLPQHRGQPELLLGMYLQAAITGDTLPGVITVPREALHEGDVLRLATDSSTLELRPVGVVRRGDGSVCIDTGVAAGERLIVSDLPAAIPGMLLTPRPAASADTRP